jgi:ribose 5-phosphate isomerase B
MKPKIAIAADHGGFALKEALKVARPDIDWLDIGAAEDTPTDDYPDYGFTLAMAVAGGHAHLGIGICGAGVGMSIALNRHPMIRAALCTDAETARMARIDNNANVLVFQGRMITPNDALPILDTFINTPFSAEARHVRRVAKLSLAEDAGCCDGPPHDHGGGGGCCGGGCH